MIDFKEIVFKRYNNQDYQMINPKSKYYKIQNKSQIPNLKERDIDSSCFWILDFEFIW